MKKLVIAVVAALTLGLAAESKADAESWKWSPIGLGIVAPIQIPYMKSDVCGLRLGGILGWNKAVYGIDVGLAQVAMDDEIALQAGICNVIKEDFGGVQLGLVNYVGSASRGVQLGLITWSGLEAYGFQLSLVNADMRSITGVSFGALNYASEVHGAQLGVINLANKVSGFQIGCINACDDMHGIQIGAINMITTSPVPVLPIVNVMF